MEPNATGGTPAPTTQSPPPAPPPPAAPPPSAATGGGGVTPAAGSSPPVSPSQPATPQIPADVQAQLDRYRGMEGEYQQLKQYSHLIPLGYRAYQQGTQPPAPAATPKQAHPWGLPTDFDKRYLNFVGRDSQTGELALRPGAPPDALIRVQEYQAKLLEANELLFSDPVKALTPIFEQLFGDRFQKQFGEQYGQIQQQQTTRQIVEANRDWLYAKDAQGHPVTQFDPASGSHKPVLSPYGQQYAQFVRQAVQYGVADPQAQHDFAVQGLQNMLFQQQFAQQRQQQAGQTQQQQFIQNAQVTAGQQLQQNAANTTPAPAQPMTLKEVMAKEFASNGVTDRTISVVPHAA